VITQTHPVAQTPDAKVTVAFVNLRAVLDGNAAPFERTFGSASYRLLATGFPLDLSIGGANGMFVSPFLSWYLPEEPMGRNASVPIAEISLGKTIHISGSAALNDAKAGVAQVKLNLTVVDSDPSLPSAVNSSFESMATFSSKTGVLLAAEGQMRSPGHVVKFHIKRK
jgi:hypothetical protein